MDFEGFWAEMWARCGPAHMGFEQCEAARDVYEKAKAKIEAAERERCEARFHAALAAGRDVLDRQVREGVRAYVEQTIRNEWIRGA